MKGDILSETNPFEKRFVLSGTTDKHRGETSKAEGPLGLANFDLERGNAYVLGGVDEDVWITGGDAQGMSIVSGYGALDSGTSPE
jgi:hypothetical protein